MKKIISITLFLLIISISGYSQDIPDKSNTIIITLPDSNGLSDKVMKVIADKDYTGKAGKNGVIVTAAKTLKNGARVSYYFKLSGTDIFLTGILPVAGQANMVISFQGKKGTPIMNGWEEMDKIAKAFGGKIKYEVK